MNSNSDVPTLGISFIKNVSLPFPPEEEQRQIAVHLDGASKALDGLRRGLNKLRNHKLGLMHDLLTSEVRVPVPNPETTA